MIQKPRLDQKSFRAALVAGENRVFIQPRCLLCSRKALSPSM
jgi:hypothetical protein